MTERKLHPATADLVARFSEALADKLAAAEEKYGYSDGWLSPDWMDECRQKLEHHLAKGDPRDVAAYCAFLWHHKASTSGSKPELKFPAEPTVEARGKYYAALIMELEDSDDHLRFIWNLAMDEASACVRKAGLE